MTFHLCNPRCNPETKLKLQSLIFKGLEALDQVRPPTRFNGRASVNAGALLYQDFIFFGRKILAGGKSQFVLFSRFCGCVFGVIWRKGVFHGYHSNP